MTTPPGDFSDYIRKSLIIRDPLVQRFSNYVKKLFYLIKRLDYPRRRYISSTTKLLVGLNSGILMRE